MADDRIEIPDEVYRDATHQDWERCIRGIGLNLNSMANDVYELWNQRQAPKQSMVMALRYMHKEILAALYWAKKERDELNSKTKP